MKKIFISVLLLSALPFVGCVKPEVVPAPTNTADLRIHFQGVINGSDVEWTKNVNGYSADVKKIITPFTDPTTMQKFNSLAYSCGMVSSSKVSAIQISLGSLLQDVTLGTSPNATTFRAFMDANLAPLTPVYSDTARSGFEVRYTDESGRLFRSDETMPGLVLFEDYVEKEDAQGEYLQFKVTFNCQVNHWGKTVLLPKTDSILSSAFIQNAVLTGYFQR